MTDLDVVIVQDRLNVPGGGERVVHEMSKLFNTTVVTGDYTPESTYDFSHTDVVEIGANSFPSFVRLRHDFDWEQFDVAIFSGNRPQFTLWRPLPIPTIRYCHSPVRTFWSLRDRNFRNNDLPTKLLRSVAGPTIRRLDSRFTHNHDQILTNSHNIRNQVDRFYGLDADVLYPPIPTDDYEFVRSGDFWLSVNRLVPKKRVIEQLRAFEGTGERLVIVGDVDETFATYGERVLSLADKIDAVEVRGFVSDEELSRLYATCKGLVFLPYFEDFGIVPVEAMASGKPVVAAAEGGPLETVVHDRTGWCISPKVDTIRDAIQTDFDPEAMRDRCQGRSERFDIDVFADQYREHVSQVAEQL